MGAQQSSGRDQTEGSFQPVKTCYYELLGVERDASDDEYVSFFQPPLTYPYLLTSFRVYRIKKSYRKRALELHPDRNLNDVQNATRRFAEIQAAYEVLSDPQERAWYDSHRDAILRGAEPDDSDARSPEFNNVKLTSTDDIFSLIRRFNSTVPFTDEPSGFFGIAKATFDHLADEEIAAGEYAPGDIPDYPSFGFSTDSYEAVAKPFYGAWASFSTRKTFAWKDKYRLSDAPDRRVRRLMEKENKKMRDEAIREFNDAVRFLVTFVRKRDPRYLPNTQTAAERQESLRTAAAAQAARSRAANKEKLSEAFVPDWAQARDEADAGGHFSESEEEESEVEEIECVVCNKTFKSEKSFEAHERSKKHVKAVQQLRRQMRNEDLDLSLHETSAMPDKVTLVEDTQEVTDEQQHSEAAKANDEEPVDSTIHTQETELSDTSSDLLVDDEYASRDDVEKRLFDDNTPHAETSRDGASKTDYGKGLTSLEDLSLGDDDEADDYVRAQPRKVGKAKAKREKRAARQAAEEAQASNVSLHNKPFMK
ncbi:protein DnaJ subfamily C member 21 [Colletotrichum spaethianum]|uniref:Protein DnaJ subfamily C member 21 n=1 Tax=Colletotrichum spaethianum TaxID=700344 RepID=A0AA37L5Q1_9PEZI|nr:protein DnaJ subfamily C member 21 [Colletotrichum spaethianum]GKT39925.1 protein DnaJ subfamily C member 21 [Colletotrichum spaethianum]